MNFRRSSDTCITSPRWLAKNRAALADAGVPFEVLSDHRTWIYVLLHGDDELQSGWNAQWLSAEQCRKLQLLIVCDSESEMGYDLFGVLKRTLANDGTDNSGKPPNGPER